MWVGLGWVGGLGRWRWVWEGLGGWEGGVGGGRGWGLGGGLGVGMGGGGGARTKGVPESMPRTESCLLCAGTGAPPGKTALPPGRCDAPQPLPSIRHKRHGQANQAQGGTKASPPPHILLFSSTTSYPGGMMVRGGTISACGSAAGAKPRQYDSRKGRVWCCQKRQAGQTAARSGNGRGGQGPA